jgi:hypothetical protein
MSKHITRRSAIKGLTLGAGSSILGPVLSQLTAHAAGSPPRQRFVFVVQSNGMDPNHIIPSGFVVRKDRELPGNDTTIESALAGHELPAAIADLAPFTDRLTLLRGLSGRIAEGGTGGHSTNHGALGCYPGSQGPMAQTIDCALGEALPSIAQNVGIGILSKPDQTLNYQISASGPGKALPIQCSPQQAFRGLFGSVIGGENRAAFDRRTNLLDFMREDVRRARASIAGEERDKLDDYLRSFESLHLRQGKIDAIKPAMTEAMPKLDEQFSKPTEVNRLQAQFEIGAAALIAGLTNVLTLTSGGGGQQYISFPDLGVPIDGHEYGHGKGVNGLTPTECFVKVRQYHCKLIAALAARLASIREGDGTMLDNTLIIYLSDSGEAHHPSLKEWPVVLLGGLRGKLKPGGRYVQLPSYGQSKHRTLSNLYLTLLQAAGKPRAKFGLPDTGLRDIDQSGVIDELLV